MGSVCLEREALVDVPRAMATEWSLANGRGGYAAGTALGANARSSHGLLVAELEQGTRVLVAKIDEEVELDERADGERIALSTSEYHDGTLHPAGHLHLEGFAFDGARAGWRWCARGVGLEKTIAVAREHHRTIVRYRLFDSEYPLRLRLMPFLTDRAPSETTTGQLGWRWRVEPRPEGVVARSRDDAPPVGLFAWRGRDRQARRPGSFVETGMWYWRFLHRADRAEGRAPVEDLYTPGLLVFDLQPGDSVWLALTAEPADMEQPQRIDPEADLDAASRPRTNHAVPSGPSLPVREVVPAPSLLAS